LDGDDPAQADLLVNKFWFVAERRLNLARPFKAGIEQASTITSRQRRLSEYFSRR